MLCCNRPNSRRICVIMNFCLVGLHSVNPISRMEENVQCVSQMTVELCSNNVLQICKCFSSSIYFNV